MLQRLLPFGDCKGSHFFLASKSFSTFFLPSGFFLFHLDGAVRFMPCCVHRFLISGPDLRIDARFSPFPPSSVHRFLISGSDLRIDVSFSPFTATCVLSLLICRRQFGNRCMDCPETASLLQRFLISGPDLRITAAPSSQQCGMARLQRSLRLRWFASDSTFRSGKEE